MTWTVQFLLWCWLTVPVGFLVGCMLAHDWRPGAIAGLLLLASEPLFQQGEYHA